MIDLTTVVVAVITVLGSLVTAVVIPWLRAKLGAEKQEVVLSVAGAVVLAVEQVYTALNGEEKKAAAMAKVRAWLAQYKIAVDDEAISDAIESAVLAMKMEAGKPAG